MSCVGVINESFPSLFRRWRAPSRPSALERRLAELARDKSYLKLAEPGGRHGTLTWPRGLWALIAAEVLLFLWLGAARESPFSVHPDAALAWRSLLVGTGEHPGIALPLCTLNLLAVVALWVAHRGARLHEGHRGPTTWTALLGAAVLALLAVLALVASRALPEPHVQAILERTDATTYETTHFD